MSVLIVAEHDNSALNPNFACAVSAALPLCEGAGATALVLGENCGGVAEQAARVSGVGKVLLREDSALANRFAENAAPVIAAAGKGGGGGGGYGNVVMAAGAFARDVLPRAAALADSQPLADVIRVVDAETFVRPIYAGNAWATVRMTDAVKFWSARTTAFAPAHKVEAAAAIEALGGGGEVLESGLAVLKEKRAGGGERPDLASARIVISGGRGVGGAEGFRILERIADKLGAAVGASRAAVDAGYVTNDYQVGQTGKIVAPDLYLAVGISGAIQHLAGMKDSKVIAAINKDADAPIFEMADYGLVADLNEALAELEKAL